ncbi:MAG: hypothetical protein HQK72_02995 [Desulfamplus sp.]|nr:hypothetical protein [Desulfamplus sp.]
MELKSLFLGILFSVGIFSFKAGLGMNYRLKQKGNRAALLGWAAFAAVYAVLFYSIAAAVGKIDIMANIENIQQFVQGGMVIHFLFAAMLMFWGIYLLKFNKKLSKPLIAENQLTQLSPSWLLLVVPCPVCMTVIGVSTAFLLALFPDIALFSVSIFYILFLTLSFLTAVFMGRLEARLNISPELLLGYAMTAISAYFLLSIIIMPQFSGLDEIYSIASNSYTNQDNSLNLILLTLVIATAGSLFLAGYLYMQERIIRYMSNINK